MPRVYERSYISSLSNARSFIFGCIDNLGLEIVYDNRSNGVVVYKLHGIRVDEYLRVAIAEVTSSTFSVELTLYYYWSQSSNTGSTYKTVTYEYNRAYTFAGRSYPYNLSNPGRKRACFVLSLSLEPLLVGVCAMNYITRTTRTITQSIQAGSNVTIPLNSIEGIYVPSYYCISTNNVGGTSRCVVYLIDKSASNKTVTVTNLPIDVPANSLLTKFISEYCIFNNTTMQATSVYSYNSSSLSLSPTQRWAPNFPTISNPTMLSHFDTFTLLYIPFRYDDSSQIHGFLDHNLLTMTANYDSSIIQPVIHDSLLPVYIAATDTVTAINGNVVTLSRNYQAGSLVDMCILSHETRACRVITANYDNTVTLDGSFAVGSSGEVVIASYVHWLCQSSTVWSSGFIGVNLDISS